MGRSLKHVRILRNTEKWILREPVVHLFVRRPSWDTLTRSPFYQQSQSKSVVPTKSTDLFRNFTSEKQLVYRMTVRLCFHRFEFRVFVLCRDVSSNGVEREIGAVQQSQRKESACMGRVCGNDEGLVASATGREARAAVTTRHAAHTTGRGSPRRPRLSRRPRRSRRRRRRTEGSSIRRK